MIINKIFGKHCSLNVCEYTYKNADYYKNTCSKVIFKNESHKPGKKLSRIFKFWFWSMRSSWSWH